MTSDTSERGLERLICTALTGSACDPGTVPAADEVRERPAAYAAGWICGRPERALARFPMVARQATRFLPPRADRYPAGHATSAFVAALRCSRVGLYGLRHPALQAGAWPAKRCVSGRLRRWPSGTRDVRGRLGQVDSGLIQTVDLLFAGRCASRERRCGFASAYCRALRALEQADAAD